MNLKGTFDIWKKTRGEEIKKGALHRDWYKNLLEKLNKRVRFLNLLLLQSYSSILTEEEIKLIDDFLNDLVSRGSWWGGIYQGLPSKSDIENCIKPCLKNCLENIVNNHWNSSKENWNVDISTIKSELDRDFDKNFKNKPCSSNGNSCDLPRDFPALRNRILSCLFPEQMTTIFGEAYFNQTWRRIVKNYGTKNNAASDYITRNQTLMEEILGNSSNNEDIALAKIFFWEISGSNYNIYELLQASKQIILYGAPGTGKTYTAQQVVKEFVIKCENTIEQLENEDKISDSDVKLEDYRFSKKCPLKVPQVQTEDCEDCKTGLYEIIQFHPNYTYQDFIGGISPNVNGDQIAYELKEGIFQRFCKIASKNEKCNFVLIIDEINRANLSEVFGELLYALEYRGKSINIPYFGEFTIPENVYIIGTMNDVDKSLVTFDLALRRRFGFFELAPNLDTLSNMFMFQDKNKKDYSLIEQNCLELYIKRCKELNNKIKSKNEDKDKDGLALEDSYQIGQAYFKKIENFLDKKKPDQSITPFELEKLWLYHLEPLLKEYLGMSLDSNEIKTKLEGVKKAFIEELK
jgi:Cdc6-like AAA superfamily ATPase